MQEPSNPILGYDLVLIRHASTEWNELGLYQGQADIPLSPGGLEELSKLAIPDAFSNWKLYSSPLQRAVQTAESLFGRSPSIISEAIEQDYGNWEGKPPQHGPEVGWSGAHLPIPGGESIHDVQSRMQKWLKEFYESGESGVLVTHKGVIFALLALAYHWDVTGKKPFKFDSKKMQHLRVSENGQLSVVQLNVEFSSK